MSEKRPRGRPRTKPPEDKSPDAVKADCAHCAELSLEIERVRQQLADAGRDVAPRETRADDDVERELARWLTTSRESDAAAGFRAGWHRFARLSGPRVREWESLWWQAQREGDQL